MSYLKLIIGPMFSSKTSTLLAELNRYKYITDKILVINNELDKKRTNNIECIRTHDNKTFPSLMIKELYLLKNNPSFNEKYQNADIILIDEGQFYKDLYLFIKNELEITNKLFIVSGLNSDFNMNPIGDIIKLVPLADEILKLRAYCIFCKDGTLASFTKLNKCENKENIDNKVLVGGSETYSPCCRKHYYTN